jgi:hypothetical protein
MAFGLPWYFSACPRAFIETVPEQDLAGDVNFSRGD